MRIQKKPLTKKQMEPVVKLVGKPDRKEFAPRQRGYHPDMMRFAKRMYASGFRIKQISAYMHIPQSTVSGWIGEEWVTGADGKVRHNDQRTP